MSAGPSSLEDFRGVLARYPGSDLVFIVDGIEIKPGYHVTKIKSARVTSIDCGRVRAAWQEVVAQLFDGPVSGCRENGAGSRMSASKFRSILDAALDAILDSPGGELYFEFALNNVPMKRYTVGNVEAGEARTAVNLDAVFVRCDPVDRWRAGAGEQPNSGSCCR